MNGSRSTRRFAHVRCILLFCLLTTCCGRADAALEESTLVRNAQPTTATINGRTLALRWINGGSYGIGQNYTPTGRADLAYLWDGKTAWSVDPTRCSILNTLPSKFQVLAISPDRSLALVQAKTGPALMDVKTQKPDDAFDGFQNFHRWTFSPNGKFVYPLAHHHGTQTYRYIDVEKKFVVELSLWKDQEQPASLSGVVASDGKSLTLLAHAQKPDDWRVRFHKLITFPLDDPAQMTMQPAPAEMEEIFAVRDGKILALWRKLQDARGKAGSSEFHLAWVDTHHTASLSPSLRYGRVFHVGFSPDGNDIYALDALDGLSIYRASTLELIANPKAGRTANAYSIGATFSEDGKFSYVTEPYAGKVYVIDVAARKVVETNDQLGQGIAGVLPIGDECFVITTLLPYE